MRNVKAEILSTGDEVLWGDIDDTNSSWLSRNLRETYGIEVTRTSCIGDRLEDIAGMMKEISNRADIALVTGGLGPTSDDLSAEAAALATEDEIVLNIEALLLMESFFEKRGWILSEANRKQAMLPSRASVMDNECGTAPGFSIELNNTVFFFMPGVPKEMKRMFENSVLPAIKNRFSGDDSKSSRFMIDRFKLFGLPESKVGSTLKDFNNHFPGLKLGFRASFPIIEVKFSAFSRDNVGDELNNESVTDGTSNQSSNVTKKMKEAHAWVDSRLDGYIFSYDNLSMEEELGRLLSFNKKSVAVAESCTGGLIGSMLTDVAGSSDYFLMSAVTYSNEAKMNVLGVNEATLIKYGAVHEETAKEMAVGVRRVAGSDFGLATTGIAGPGGGTEEKPVGTICIGIAGEGFVKSYRFTFTYGDRSMFKKMFAVKAMDLLRREILERACS